jgi:hypothetical protein
MTGVWKTPWENWWKKVILHNHVPLPWYDGRLENALGELVEKGNSP